MPDGTEKIHSAFGPVTIGDLKRDRKPLEIECSSCHRHLYEEPSRFPFRDAEPMPVGRRPTSTSTIPVTTTCHSLFLENGRMACCRFRAIELGQAGCHSTQVPMLFAVL